MYLIYIMQETASLEEQGIALGRCVKPCVDGCVFVHVCFKGEKPFKETDACPLLLFS